MGDLWETFITLNQTRPASMAVSAITEQEIRAYCLNRGIALSIFELDAIHMLDGIAMTDFTKDDKNER
jgi:hypothetical protein